MTTVETAERKGHLRATIFYVLALALAAALWVSFDAPETGPRQAIWVALATASAMNLAPLLRWLKPHSPVATLLEDETSREHRRTATAAGFWSALGAMALLLAVTDDHDAVLSGYDAARLIATVAIVAGLVVFATLERRAARD